MTHKEAKCQENKEKLKANNLSFIFESETPHEFDLRIETLAGEVLVSDLQYHIDPSEWLDENINKAICRTNSLKQTSDHCEDAFKYSGNSALNEIDKFLEKLSLNNPEDFYLRLHTSFRLPLIEENKKVRGFSGIITRYRDFLLIFEEDIEPSLMYVGFIFDEICRLRALQSNHDRFFSQKEFDTLKYLLQNRFVLKD